MDSLKNTFNQAKEKVNEGISGSSAEANKHVAKDSNASLQTRGTAAKDYVGDKLDEHKHAAQADVHKNKPT